MLCILDQIIFQTVDLRKMVAIEEEACTKRVMEARERSMQLQMVGLPTAVCDAEAARDDADRARRETQRKLQASLYDLEYFKINDVGWLFFQLEEIGIGFLLEE